MGKGVEKIKLVNVFNPNKTVKLEAIIDTGAKNVGITSRYSR